jgi:ABC-2 type transport system ATP-binding protein
VAIDVTDLRKSYGQREVVRGVSFGVGVGECFGLLGHNGAGKTTILEILEGFLSRDDGSVSVLGVDPQHGDAQWRGRLGIVLQDMDGFPTLTVAETMRMFADLYPQPRDVAETIKLVNLESVASSRVGSLSGGEKRRLDVALGLVGNPELLFLDEPTTGLDPAARRDSWTMIEGLKQLGVTIVLTTHYMDEAQILADRLVIIDAGVVAAEGTFNDLQERFGTDTTVSFRLPPDDNTPDGLSAIGVATKTDVGPDGLYAEFASNQPQRDLHLLLNWAAKNQIALSELTVQRSSLESLFLSIGAEGAGVASSDQRRSPNDNRRGVIR